MSYEAIADELEVSVAACMTHYRHACDRMMQALKLADMKEATIAKYKLALERSEKATGKLPKYMKWLLMNKVFDLTVGDIAELEGTTSNIVASKIRVAYDRLVTGEYQLLEPAPDQIEAAQLRMVKKRASERKPKVHSIIGAGSPEKPPHVLSGLPAPVAQLNRVPTLQFTGDS